MAYNLIPLPISIVFIIVFGIAWLLVLRKMHKRGKMYSFLFWLSVVLVRAAFVLSLAASITG
jgi:hypothetical protein